jgi:hypothetical protein
MKMNFKVASGFWYKGTVAAEMRNGNDAYYYKQDKCM